MHTLQIEGQRGRFQYLRLLTGKLQIEAKLRIAARDHVSIESIHCPPASVLVWTAVLGSLQKVGLEVIATGATRSSPTGSYPTVEVRLGKKIPILSHNIDLLVFRLQKPCLLPIQRPDSNRQL